MKANNLLDELHLESRDILLEFFATYSRLEYALKRKQCTTSHDGRAEPDWCKFISENKNNFNTQKDTSLKKSVDYLLSFPAQQQIVKNGKLDFSESQETKIGSTLCRLYHCLRITRNNLFHGGKFPLRPISELSRNNDLIGHCLTVLKEITKLDPVVESYFWEVGFS